MTILTLLILAPSIHIYIGVFFIILFIIFSSLISASEIAYFSLSPSNIKEIKDNKSKLNSIILKQLNNSERLLATLLITNTFFNISIVIISTYISSNLSITINPTLAFIFQVVILTLIILFFGEILPKVYATQNNLPVLKFLAFPVSFLITILYPLSSLLLLSSSFIVKHFSSSKRNISIGDLKHAIDLASQDLKDDEKILKGIVKFRNIDVKEIMKYRNQVVAVDIKDSFSKLISIINDKGYSRIPVISEGFDNINGIIFIKDLLPHSHKNDTFRWQSLIRPAYFVPETKKINELLKDFQAKKNHIAVVVDEYGGTSGLVSLEDIIEEIVGDISDEFDDEDVTFSKLDENNYIFDGKTALKDFYKILKIEDTSVFENNKGEAETVAGFVLEILGSFPKQGTKINFKNYVFTIEALDKKRIKLVKLTMLND